MSNQEKKNSLPEDSRLNPVGVVSAIQSYPQMRGGTTTIGVAHVDLSLAPVGSELYVKPSVGRLTCEVQVANDNALHWKEGLNKANIRTAEQRTEKYKVMAQLREVGRRFNNGTLTAADVANAIEGTLYIPE